jgi:hypothetical protein
MRKIWGISAVAVLALTGCGASAPATQPSESQSSNAESSSASAAAPETSSASPTAKAQIGESICKDKLGDSKSEAVDISRVRLLSDGSLMFMNFTTVADVPTTGTVLYSVTAWSTDGKTGYQLGVKFQDGTEIANFVFNLTAAQQENVTNGAIAAEKQVSTRYPLSMLEGLGDTFKWSATVTVDGADVDRCPDGGLKNQFPEG